MLMTRIIRIRDVNKSLSDLETSITRRNCSQEKLRAKSAIILVYMSISWISFKPFFFICVNFHSKFSSYFPLKLSLIFWLISSTLYFQLRNGDERILFIKYILRCGHSNVVTFFAIWNEFVSPRLLLFSSPLNWCQRENIKIREMASFEKSLIIWHRLIVAFWVKSKFFF